MWQAVWRVIVKIRVILVTGLKDEKLIKKQTYTKTETYKLYCRVFWIFQLNVMKIDPYDFELYHFKLDAFFETQCMFGHFIPLL